MPPALWTPSDAEPVHFRPLTIQFRSHLNQPTRCMRLELPRFCPVAATTPFRHFHFFGTSGRCSGQGFDCAAS
ncbi:unnamed protein product [Protopolystoma xenopodis]|uniref:Uncharacterized protein n=1 Tax=Protopolystoma xenopodis TaxID=117903 RepID=A0A3S5BD14_9PLAT|nr:unnamed protein product [Protopolystoma xenopodis]